jgi:ATP-citrate lyase beta-subunit
MAQKPIREVQAKKLLKDNWGDKSPPTVVYIEVNPETDIKTLPKEHLWLKKGKLVVKVDELFGKRGKLGYVKIAKDFKEAQKWIEEHRGKEVTINDRKGTLNNFIIEPFIEHKKEYYLAFTCEKACDVILFSDKGGIEVEDLNEKDIARIEIPLPLRSSDSTIAAKHGDFRIAATVPKTLQPTVAELFRLFRNLDLGYLEINPLVYEDKKAYLLDAVCRVDTCAMFRPPLSNSLPKGERNLPEGFGSNPTKEEVAIRELDAKTGSSLKFVLLNPKGRIWTMVAGGGASIIYADDIINQVNAKELANYGEWSGNPSTDEMEQYTKNILELVTKNSGKQALIIGGGIANFTDVKKTFTGVIKALESYKDRLKDLSIFVRRAGPNDTEGLAMLQKACDEIHIPCVTYGADLPMTDVVSMAVEKLDLKKLTAPRSPLPASQ